MGFFDIFKSETAEDYSLVKTRNILERLTESIRSRFSCQVLPPDIIDAENWKTKAYPEIDIIDLVRVDNNWSIDEFDDFFRTKKVFVCTIHIRIDMESMNDNIVSPTYGHWGDWDMENWMEENIHVPVLAVGIKRDSLKNPYRCFRFVLMDNRW